MFKFFFIVLNLLLLTFSFTFVQAKPERTEVIHNSIEIWEGIGSQDDNSTWSIRFTRVGQHYFIDYPSLNCGGKLVIVSTNSNRMKYIEQLSYGKSRCLDNGRVTITKNKDISAKFSYTHPEGIAEGILIKR